MKSLFISYSHRDKRRLKNFVELIPTNYNVWFDRHLMGGQPWKQRLEEQIKKCDVFIFFSSRNANRSDWCVWEIQCAIKYGKPILPICSEKDAILPALREIQHLPLFEVVSHDEFIEILVASIENAVLIPIDPNALPEINLNRGAPGGGPILFDTGSGQVRTFTIGRRSCAVNISVTLTIASMFLVAVFLFALLPALNSSDSGDDISLANLTTEVDTTAGTQVAINISPTPTNSLNVIPPTQSATAFSTQGQVLSDCTGRFSQLGGTSQARVIPGGGPNNLRDAPSLSSGRIGSIPETEIVTLLSGPRCVDGHMWWQVSYGGLIGWTSEGTQSSQYLSAVTVAATSTAGTTSNGTAVVVGATDTPVVNDGGLSGSEGLTWSEGPLTAAQRADLYSGSWVNENVNTNSITRIEISVDANNVPYMHWWGKCHPQDCDNGTHQVTWRNPLDGGLFFHTTTSFSINDFTFLALTDGRLWVQKYTEFTDNSGRQPYTVHEYFVRQ